MPSPPKTAPLNLNWLTRLAAVRYYAQVLKAHAQRPEDLTHFEQALAAVTFSATPSNAECERAMRKASYHLARGAHGSLPDPPQPPPQPPPQHSPQPPPPIATRKPALRPFPRNIPGFRWYLGPNGTFE